MLDETPTIAPDTLVVHQNTSVMHDEILAQRLGLIPIAADPRQFDFPDENINENNTIVYVLDIKAGDETINVFSGDLQFSPIGNQLSRHGNIRPLIEEIPIIKLGPRQHLKFELYCHKGTGRVHAKWSPCSVAFFKMNPMFKYKGHVATLDSRSLPQLAEIADKINCPKHVFDDLEDLRVDECTLCRECLDTGLSIALDDSDYTFIIEPTGYLNGIEIMREALLVLKTKA